MKVKYFLPQDYQEPESDLYSNYLELQVGDNPIRIISECFPGWLWREDQEGHVLSDPEPGCKVKKVRTLDQVPKSVQENPNFEPVFFWVFAVLNRDTNRVQIACITQKSIRKKIKYYRKNAHWGEPFSYDLVISREGEGKQTKYDVMPLPKQPLEEEALAVIRQTSIDFDAYFEGRDPFGVGDEKQEAQEPVAAATNPVRRSAPVQGNGPAAR